MKYNLSIKLFFYIFVIAMLIFFYTSLINIRRNNDNLLNRNIEVSVEQYISNKGGLQKLDTKLEMKYILQWTSPKNIPFISLSVGQETFIKRNCTFTNCFVTSNRTYLGDYTKFDVIAFAGPEIVRVGKSALPNKRSPSQKFVFASLESPDYYPVCSDKLDDFFNWTWTYKTNSDERWCYIVIRDSNNKIIGPNAEMHWMKLADMDPVSNEFKEKLKTKQKAAAWFVSNCKSRSHREAFVRELKKHLVKYKLGVDVYGGCGTLKCPTDKIDECTKMIETDYYFYLSFENSFGEDYVTEKLLYPLENNAIPIVFGAANYSRFMPDGIYLNARELGAEKLAEKMNELILNPDLYAEYFRWKNHYSYSDCETADYDEYCKFCAMINDEELVKKISTYPNFRKWWDMPNRC